MSTPPRGFEPAWHRIARAIAAGIPDRWGIDVPIPTHAQLAAEYGVSSQPVQRAVKHLRDRGVLQGARRLGVVVVRIPEPADLPSLDEVSETAWRADVQRQLAEHDTRLRALEERD